MIVFDRPWTWREFDAAAEEMLKLFDSVSYKVDVIFDIRHAGFPPPDALNRFRKVANIQHPNGGKLIYIAPATLANFMSSMAKVLSITYMGSNAFKKPKFIFTKSLEEARTHLSSTSVKQAG